MGITWERLGAFGNVWKSLGNVWKSLGNVWELLVVCELCALSRLVLPGLLPRNTRMTRKPEGATDKTRMEHGWNTENDPCLLCVQSLFASHPSSLVLPVTTHYPLSTIHSWAVSGFDQHTTVYKCCQRLYRIGVRFRAKPLQGKDLRRFAMFAKKPLRQPCNCLFVAVNTCHVRTSASAENSDGGRQTNAGRKKYCAAKMMRGLRSPRFPGHALSPQRNAEDAYYSLLPLCSSWFKFLRQKNEGTEEYRQEMGDGDKKYGEGLRTLITANEH